MIRSPLELELELASNCIFDLTLTKYPMHSFGVHIQYENVMISNSRDNGNHVFQKIPINNIYQLSGLQTVLL